MRRSPLRAMLVATTALTATPLLIAPSAYAQQITQGGGNGGATGNAQAGLGGIAGGGGGANSNNSGGQAAQTLTDLAHSGGGPGGGAAGGDISGGGGGAGGASSGSPGGNGGHGQLDGLNTSVEDGADSNQGSGGGGSEVTHGGTINPTGTLTGGAGGTSNSGGGGGGGAGWVFLPPALGGPDASLTLSNGNSITGGSGGGSTLSNAGDGGAGVFFYQGGTLNNGGLIAGGKGGESLTEAGGNGAAGVLSNGALLTNSGAINGGIGALGRTGGAGGNAIEMFGGTLTSAVGGTITGGTGGQAIIASGGNGGDGVLIRSGAEATVTNNGTITGGDTGPTNAPFAPVAGYGVEIKADNSTLINNGVIQGGRLFDGGLNNGAQADAVHITGNNNRLELWSAAQFNGLVTVAAGKTATFALGGATDGQFNLAQLSSTAQFQGFTSFDKSGTSTWTLTGFSSFTGPMTISDGTLKGGNAGVFGIFSPLVISSGAFLDLGGFDQEIGTLAGAGTVTNSGGTTATLTTNGASTPFSGVIQDGAAGAVSLLKTGAGTLALTGANTYTGDTSIDGGTLAIQQNGSIISAVSLHAAFSTFDISGATADQTIKGLSGDGGTVVQLGSKTLTFGDGSNQTFAGSITGTGGLIKQGSGTEILTGTSTYSGETTINEGALQANHANALSSFSDYKLTSGASALVVNFNNTIGSLSGITGNVAINDGATLTVGADNTDTTYSGQITEAGAVSIGNFTKTGTGTLVLTGANTYSGNTTVNTGTLEVDGSISSSRLTTVNANATLAGGGTVGNTTINSGGTLAPGGALSTGTLTVNGDLTANNAQLTFKLGTPGANFDIRGQSDHVAVTGDLTISASTLNIINLGGMGPGVYNLFTWGGTFNGSAADFSGPNTLQILTGSKEINLINTAGFTLDMWDGNGLASSTTTGGGDGTWSINSNVWSDAAGHTPEPMTPQPGFAVFGGASGLVTVDNINGSVSATGMQFMTDGYHLTGGDIALIGSAGDAPHMLIDSGVTAKIDNVLTGTDGLNKLGAGTLVLNGVNTYTGTTTLSEGELSVSSNANLGAASNSLAFDGGILQTTQTMALAQQLTWGSNGGGFDVANGTTLTVGHVAGQDISGTGSLIKLGAGTLALEGNNTYSGATDIEAGELRAGSGTALSANSAYTVAAGATLNLNDFDNAVSSLAGGGAVALGAATLTFGDATGQTFAGSIQGTGGIVKQGTGIETLSGNSTYTGQTTVSDGTLIVDGDTHTSSLTTVNTGATLGGNGIVGNTLINSGGTLAPGDENSVLTVNGSLTFAAASTYLVQVTPTNAGRVVVTGTADLGGASVSANFAPGSYIEKQYTILQAATINNSFSGLANTNLPTAFKSSLSKDGTNVYLDLALDFTPPPPPAGPSAPSFGNPLNGNQMQVANTLVNYFNTHNGIPMAFGALNAQGLSQAAGETTTSSQQTTFNAMTTFMGMITDPANAERGINVTPSPLASYAAMPTKAHPIQQTFEQRWSVWASGFGGTQTTVGNTAAGTNDTTSRIFGATAGADYRLGPDTLVGFALTGGGTNFSVANGGTGRSDLFQAGAFARQNFGASYITAALAYGWQDITTDRNIMGIHLRAEFNANSYSGRIETGYRFVTPFAGGIGVSPYAATQVSAFDLPSYAERAVSGSDLFALGYGDKSITDTRTELGFRTDKSYAMDGAILTLRGRAAWAHDFDPDHSASATFQSLPGTSFVVNGAALASDSALVTASAELRWLDGWSIGATFEGEFSNVTTSVAGQGTVRYTW
jgi:autotransporter-associated beta strand protein